MIAGSSSSSRHFVVAALVVLSVVITAHLSDVRLGALFDAEGSASAWALFQGLVSPDFSPDFLARIGKLSLESLFIGVLGTALAGVIGFVLALAGTRVPELPDPPRGSAITRLAGEGVRLAVRFVLGVFRSIPDIIWAYLFVRLVGLGPGPAVLAIGISTGGIIGKLFAELAEATDPEPIHALRRAGIGRLGILLHGVLPQVQRQWVGYALFRLECSIRSASILGVVGAGGLGSEIALSVRYFEYDKLATALLAVLAYVVAFEIISAVLRRRRIRWTLGSAAIASVAALIYLDIPWSEMWTASALPASIPAIGGGEAMAMASRAALLILETIAMAWCATLAAAALAFVIAPLASGTLTVGSHLKDSLRARGPTRVLSWALLLAARLVLQVSRAMPELTLALIFVVWVGPGPFAGVLAVGIHTVGVLGRLYTDVYEEVEPGPVGALESTGASRFGIWVYGVIPQVAPRIMAFTLYRFEVNVRATAMVGFVGAGGIGDAIHTAISLFHTADLVLLLGVILGVVTLLDAVGDRVRFRILTARFGPRGRRAPRRWLARRRNHYTTEQLLAPPAAARKSARREMWKPVFHRRPGEEALRSAHVSSASTGGMFINTDITYPRGAVLEVLLAPPHTGLIEDLESSRARVVYTAREPNPGMGIELIDPPAPFLALLAASDEESDSCPPSTGPQSDEGEEHA